MIQTVIFDIGNVLVDFGWRPFLERFGLTPEEFDRVSRASVLSEDWNEFDRGVLSDEQVIARFRANDPEMGGLIDRIYRNINGLLTRRDYAIPWIRQLKERGLQVLVLSNFSEKGLRDCAEAMDFLPYVDGGILSCREKVIKPMPEIYRRLIARYDLKPDRCVFMDDLQRNLDGAAAFGIRTILFTSREEAAARLEELLAEGTPLPPVPQAQEGSERAQ